MLQTLREGILHLVDMLRSGMLIIRKVLEEFLGRLYGVLLPLREGLVLLLEVIALFLDVVSRRQVRVL